MNNIFVATEYKGKPVVLDTKTKVYYYGYKDMDAARAAAKELNA